MRTSTILASLAVLFFSIGLSSLQAQQMARVGEPAVPFSLPGSDGKDHSLGEYSGKFIVLEWTNPECPFVKKFYDSDAMQKLQREYVAKGVVWLRIDSSAPGHQGALTPIEMADYEKEHNVASTMSLIDSDGKVGHIYGATNTPELYVINPKGQLIYAGGIDDHPSADPADIPNSKNYLAAALDEAMAGKPVSISKARPYGCSIKYAN
jgi:peroxiredoxin